MLGQTMPMTTSRRPTWSALWIAGGDETVVRLTKLNKSSLAINADLIKFVETAPDTVITLSTGEKVVVTETVEQIIELIIQYRRSVLAGLSCPALGLYAVSGSGKASREG